MKQNGLNESRKGRIHVLTGPTAVGKTDLSLEWAANSGAEIVSCDPLLFYRGMDIGTAKPSGAERARVAHHLIDIAEVNRPIDIRTFLERAQAVVAEIWNRGHPVLVCGASGFYLQAFYRPVVDSVEVTPAVRRSVEILHEEKGLGALVDELRRLNPDGLGELDTRNPRRVVRALERCLASGRDLASLRVEMDRTTNCLIEAEKLTVRLSRSREELDRRIERRARQMLEAGLVEEVERLLEKGLLENPSAARAVGYREVTDWLPGARDPGELVAAITLNTRRLVRKQMNWFRNQFPAHRVIDLQEGGEEAASAELFASGAAGGGSMEIP